MRRWTLRGRLVLLYGGLFFVAGSVLLGVTYVLVDRSLRDQLESSESARLAAARADLAADDAASGPSPEDEAALDELVENVQADQEQLRETALESLLTRGGFALAGVGVVAVALGWVMAGRVLQPLQRITQTAHRIAGANVAGQGLHERISLDAPDDEVKQLADTFDSMLDNLDRSFDGQRRFVANASHELRTPLAINRALVELAITRPDAAEETRRLGDALLAVNRRHERLIDGLLTLADSESTVTERSPIDLADVGAHVLEQAGGAASEAGVDVRSDLEPAPVEGDPVLVERLVQNLVENAVRHNGPGGWLSVTTGSGKGRARLLVANTGPTIPGYEVESLFQPFRRHGDRLAGPDRGVGLGLSIVRAIARAHGGEATAAPRQGGGLVVAVELPLRP